MGSRSTLSTAWENLAHGVEILISSDYPLTSEESQVIYTLEDFIREYTAIRDMGWVRTHRSGPTGIGKTLEDLLGIPENNIDGPDFGDYELKSCRMGSPSMLTMFTKTPSPKGAANTLLQTFGYSSGAYDNTDKVLHATLSSDRYVDISRTGHRLAVRCEPDRVDIIAEDGLTYAFWSRRILQAAFERKYRNKFVYAKASTRGSDIREEFWFKEAYEVSGFDYRSFEKLLLAGKIYIDLRIGQYHSGRNKGKTHDHGTAFRIRETDQPLLFRINRRIV